MKPFNIKILDYYIFTQLLGPFLFGFFMFVTVIAIDPLMSALQNIVNENVPITVVLRWFLFRLPQDMIFTFPMAVLLSSLLVFGRMSKDSETIALKAGGINFNRVLIPVVVFAIMITTFSFLFNELVVPHANKRAQQIRRQEILRLVEPEATENSIMRASDGAFIYARKVFEAKGTMERVLAEYYVEERLIRRVSAAEAVWNGERWTLLGVVVQDYGSERTASPTAVPSMILHAVRETPTDFARLSKKPNEMSSRELKKLIETYDRTELSETTPLRVDLALKTSLPFASLFFAVIGAAFGMTSTRSGAFIGFGVSILIIFIYYVLMSFCTALGRSGYLPVFLSAWMQNIIFAVVGFFVLRRLNA